MFLAWPKSGVLVVVVIPVAATPTAFLAWQKCGVLPPRFWHAQNAVYYYRVFGMAKCGVLVVVVILVAILVAATTTAFLACPKRGVVLPCFWHGKNAVYQYRVFGMPKKRCTRSIIVVMLLLLILLLPCFWHGQKAVYS